MIFFSFWFCAASFPPFSLFFPGFPWNNGVQIKVCYWNLDLLIENELRSKLFDWIALNWLCLWRPPFWFTEVTIVRTYLCIFDRSPAIVIAYLMKSKGWKLAQSYQWVKDRRPSVDLNQGLTISVKAHLHFTFYLSEKLRYIASYPLSRLTGNDLDFFFFFSECRGLPKTTGVWAEDLWVTREPTCMCYASLPFSCAAIH